MENSEKVKLIQGHIFTKENDLIKVSIGINKPQKFINIYAVFLPDTYFAHFISGLSDLLDEIDPTPNSSNFETYKRPLKTDEAHFPRITGKEFDKVMVLDLDIKTK